MNRVAPGVALAALLLIGTHAACTDEAGDPTAPAPEPLQIAIASGDQQAAPVGTALPEFLVVRVTRGVEGPGIEGVPVGWEVLEGGSRLTVKRFATDFEGLAAASVFLGGESGEQIVRAELVDGPAVLFTARATTPEPDPVRVP